MHPRAHIRHAIRDRLKLADETGAFLTMAESTVFASRIAPISDDDYPAIMVYSRDEKDYSEPVDDSLAWRQSTLAVVIEGMVRAGESVDDKLDELAEQIENAFDGWSIPGFEAANMTLEHTDIDLVTENVRKPIGAVGLTYRITYRAKKLAEPVERIPDDVDSILFGGEPTVVIRGGPRAPVGDGL